MGIPKAVGWSRLANFSIWNDAESFLLTTLPTAGSNIFTRFMFCLYKSVWENVPCDWPTAWSDCESITNQEVNIKCCCVFFTNHHPMTV